MTRDPAAAVFDFDGTLAHLPVDWEGLRDHLRARFREKYAYESGFRPLMPELTRIRECLGEAAASDFMDVMAEWELEAAAKEVLPVEAGLALWDGYRAEGCRIAVCSNNDADAVRRVLNALGREGACEFVVGRREAPAPKPDPRGLALALAKLDAAPEGAVLVGDSDADAGAARALGVEFIRV